MSRGKAPYFLKLITLGDHTLVSTVYSMPYAGLRMFTWYQFKGPCEARKTQALKRHNWN